MPGESWHQLADLMVAFALSGLIGLEREVRQKSAGMKTYALVGLSAALFMQVSKYGFSDVLASERIVLDPSRVAAQIVSGIGFIGGGVIFMRRDVVRGLTTAASVWLTAALGMACGGGLIGLAVATTLAHFAIMFVFPQITRLLPQSRNRQEDLRVVYSENPQTLPDILITCTRLRFAILHVSLDHETERSPLVSLSLQVRGKRPVAHLIAALSTLPQVRDVGLQEDDHD